MDRAAARLDRQRDSESGPHARTADHLQATLHQRNQLFANDQPQSGAGLLSSLARLGIAVGKDVVPDEARTRDMMRCQDYLQLDPRAWTPMVIWLMNDPFSLEPPEWTDFHEAELVLTPILTEICRQEPDVWLTSLRERLNSYQQVRSLN